VAAFGSNLRFRTVGNLTALFCSMTALALCEAARRRSMGYTVIGGIALALAAPTNAVLVPLLIPLTLVFTWKRSLTRRQLLVFSGIVVASLLAWGVRNTTFWARCRRRFAPKSILFKDPDPRITWRASSMPRIFNRYRNH
jgi:4-amino-4-deoxy-L-arabinose transferase-like glycosyltransferase